MKISKKRLAKIIKEEIKREALNENPFRDAALKLKSAFQKGSKTEDAILSDIVAKLEAIFASGNITPGNPMVKKIGAALAKLEGATPTEPEPQQPGVSTEQDSGI